MASLRDGQRGRLSKVIFQKVEPAMGKRLHPLWFSLLSLCLVRRPQAEAAKFTNTSLEASGSTLERLETPDGGLAGSKVKRVTVIQPRCGAGVNDCLSKRDLRKEKRDSSQLPKMKDAGLAATEEDEAGISTTLLVHSFTAFANCNQSTMLWRFHFSVILWFKKQTKKNHFDGFIPFVDMTLLILFYFILQKATPDFPCV